VNVPFSESASSDH